MKDNDLKNGINESGFPNGFEDWAEEHLKELCQQSKYQKRVKDHIDQLDLTIENREHCVSSLVEPGDVIFFDGNLYHEIKPIYGNNGRIALFEIPTYVDKSSRDSEYAGDGEKLTFKKRVINKLNNLLKK